MKLRILFLIVLLCSSISLFTTSSGLAAVGEQQGNAQILTDMILGNPVANDDYVFWLDDSSGDIVISGYDLVQHRKFVLDERGYKWALASNATSLAWIANSATGYAQIYVRTLASGATRMVYETPAYLSNLALDATNLYYQDGTAGHQGLFALNLLTGEEKLISPRGQRPVVADGILLWSEFVAPHTVYLPIIGAEAPLREPITILELQEPTLTPSWLATGPKEWRLCMKVLAQDQSPVVIAHSKGEFSAYNLSGDTIVWSSLPPADDLRVFAYHISTAKTQILSQGWAMRPLIQQSSVVWTNYPEPEVLGQAKTWTIQHYDLQAGVTLNSRAMLAQATATIEAAALVAKTKLLFLADTNSATGRSILYISDIAQPTVTLTRTNSAPAQVASLSSGQITKNGRLLSDSNGLWKMKGVMFLLPQYGINHKQFETMNYTASAALRAQWLDLAGPGWLQANLVRIFVEMNSNTAPETVYAFALEAEARNMRVGVVLKNYADFTMTDARRQWLLKLITLFKSNNKTHLIAYVSAHNEINNPVHCKLTTDCYDQADKTYMTKANTWVYEFNKVFKDANSPILTTVGVTTEAADTDGQAGVEAFFKADNNGRILADLVDVISPHNYGGGGYAIAYALQNKGYMQPVILEEYGFPTDNVQRNAAFQESNPACRTDPGFPADSPNYELCRNTAPYYVEVNLRSIRDLQDTYAGGVAWMLADMNSHPCTGSGYAPDNFTGLFSVCGAYCGGTTSLIRPPSAKSTAFRVLNHHMSY